MLEAPGRWTWLWKPPGMPVFPLHDAGEGPSPCLLDWWRGQPGFPAADFPAGFEGGIAHRLDTATSGLILVAPTPADLATVRALFATRVLRKFYVFRSPRGGQAATIEVAIGHHPKSRRRRVVADPPHRAVRGRWYDAWTRLTPLHEDRDGWLWQAEIRTGVMHQVRVHAQHAGAPLTGDPLYGERPGPGEPGPAPTAEFLLHHAQVLFPGGERSPLALLPDGTPPSLRIGARDGLV